MADEPMRRAEELQHLRGLIQDCERQSNVWLLGFVAATVGISAAALATGSIAVLAAVPIAAYLVALRLHMLRFRVLRAQSYIRVFADRSANRAAAWESDLEAFCMVWDERIADYDERQADRTTPRLLVLVLGGTVVLTFVLALQAHLLTRDMDLARVVRVGGWLWFAAIALGSAAAYVKIRQLPGLFDLDGYRRAVMNAWKETRERLAGGEDE